MNTARPSKSYLAQEARLIERMIRHYCAKCHAAKKGELCEECATLLDYSNKRLEHCRYGENKPTCRRCPTHCYKPDMRYRIKKVMRTSGPALCLHGDMDAIKHLLKDFKDAKRGGVEKSAQNRKPPEE